MNPLETFARICLAAAQDCAPATDLKTIQPAIRKRLDALPPNERAAIEEAMKELSSYEAPGFHEHGSH